MSNSHGFTLVQAIVSTMILSVIALIVAKLVSDFQKEAFDAHRNLEFNSIVTEIDLAIASTTNCAKLFQGIKIQIPLGIDPAVPNKFEVSFPQLLNNGSEIGQLGVVKNGLEPKYFGFSKFYRSFPATGLPFNYYITDFSILFKKNGPSLGSDQKEKSYSLYLKVNNDKNIEGCGLLKDSTEGQCILQGKTYNSSKFPACF